MAPIRIFVGTPANNEDLECQAVLDYSLRKYASEELDITWMMVSRDPNSFWYSTGKEEPRKGWNMKTWATPFSALRWGIPAACNYEGRAIYMDSDMIAMDDIAKLAHQPIPDGKAFLAKGGQQVISCVMLFDNARMKQVLPDIDRLKTQVGAYRDIRGRLQNAVANYQDDWNCRDGEKYETIYDPRVKIVHYTSIPTQPNHRHARARLAREGRKHWYPGPDAKHPRQEITDLFDTTLAQAERDGRGVETFRVNPEFGEYGR